MALTADYNPNYPVAAEPVPGEVMVRGTPISLGLVAVVMLLVGAWAAIVPFVGPVFGYHPDGQASWVWNLPQAVLGLVPGAVAVVAALVILGRLPLARRGIGTAAVGWAGLLAVLAGGWLVVGPVASAVVLGTRYFVPASPFRSIMNELGFTLGPGLVIVACGAFALGWSMRQRQVTARLAVVSPIVPAGRGAVATAPVAPVAPVAQAPLAPADAEPITAVPPHGQTLA